MKTALRLYGNHGCPHCMAALAFLEASKIPVQGITVEGDPVVAAGIEKLFGKDAGVPVLISFDTKEMVLGFKVGEYERIARSYNSELGASPDSQVVVEGQPVGQTPEVALGQTPEALRTN